MEFKFAVNDIFKEPVVAINRILTPPGFTGDRRAYWDAVEKVSEIINGMGEASAAAQGLTKPITTADRLRNSDHTVYLLIDQNAGNGRGAVTGMLKTGKKGLYVFDKNGQHYQVSPNCVLDFYVHESRQRTGLGKRLFEHMLEKENVEPVKMAIDRPSDKFLGFLNKHYSLNNPVKQVNNYVVYDGFFPSSPGKARQEEESHSAVSVGKRQSANGLQTMSFASPLGRYGAPRPHCSMGQIIHNQSAIISATPEPSGVKSAPATNYQSQQVSNNPPNSTNVSASTPNVNYNFPNQQQTSPPVPETQHYVDPKYYQQQESYNVWHTLGKSDQIPQTLPGQGSAVFNKQNFNPDSYYGASQIQKPEQNAVQPQQNQYLPQQSQMQPMNNQMNYVTNSANILGTNTANMPNSYEQQQILLQNPPQNITYQGMPETQPLLQQNQQFTPQTQPMLQPGQYMTSQPQVAMQQPNQPIERVTSQGLIASSPLPQQHLISSNAQQLQPIQTSTSQHVMNQIQEVPNISVNEMQPVQQENTLSQQNLHTDLPQQPYPTENVPRNRYLTPSQYQISETPQIQQIIPQQVPQQQTILQQSIPHQMVQAIPQQISYNNSSLNIPNSNIQSNFQMPYPNINNVSSSQVIQQENDRQQSMVVPNQQIPPQNYEVNQMGNPLNNVQSQPNYYNYQVPPSYTPNTQNVLSQEQQHPTAVHSNVTQHNSMENVPLTYGSYAKSNMTMPAPAQSVPNARSNMTIPAPAQSVPNARSNMTMPPAPAQSVPNATAENAVTNEPKVSMSKHNYQDRNSVQYNILNHQPIKYDTPSKSAINKDTDNNTAVKQAQHAEIDPMSGAKGDMKSVAEEEDLMFKYGYPPQVPTVFTNKQRTPALSVKTR